MLSFSYVRLVGGILLSAVCLTVACSPASQEPEAVADGALPSAPPSAPPRSGTPPHSGASAADFPTTDWPQFRGPHGLGVGLHGRPPMEWSSTDHLRWQTELPGPGASSPITSQGRIFLACYSGYGVDSQHPGEMDQLRRHLVCLDRETGRSLWTQTIPARLPETPYDNRMLWHGYASGTPAADAERVYVSFGKSGVFAFDHRGTRVWEAQVGDRHHGWGSGASPVLYDELVIVNASVESGTLVALDRRTGKQVWSAAGIKESWNVPLLVRTPGGDPELVLGIFGEVLGFAPGSGELLWRCRGIANYIVPSLVTDGQGVVFCLAGRKRETVAVRVGGRGEVTQTHRLWTAKRGSNVASPVYDQGYLYWAHDSLGIVYCANAQTGQMVYEERLTPRPGEIYASPVLADGRLYYVSRKHGVYVVAARPRFELLAHNPRLDETAFNASPAVIGDRLLLRSDHALYCLGAR